MSKYKEDIREEGREGYLNGLNLEDNPYKECSLEYDWWATGWEWAKMDLLYELEVLRRSKD